MSADNPPAVESLPNFMIFKTWRQMILWTMSAGMNLDSLRIRSWRSITHRTVL